MSNHHPVTVQSPASFFIIGLLSIWNLKSVLSWSSWFRPQAVLWTSQSQMGTS